MQRIKPSEFAGPRSYFTAFDHRIVSKHADHDALRKDIERKLKKLLLIKAKIVCAASHLVTEFTYSIFRDNTFLLSEGHVVPALRIDKEDFHQLVEEKTMKEKNAIASFYQTYTKTAVDWDLKDNSSWFRDTFVKELQDEGSLIRRQLASEPLDTINCITDRIKNEPILGRETIDRVASHLSPRGSQIITSLRELIYHISGARVVNTESALPQEDYIDFDLADLDQKRTKLSEDQILWKLFIELALESFQRRVLSVDLLDMLSFQDILDIRKPIYASNFQQKYDQLIRIAIGKSEGSEPRLLDLSQLDDIRRNIESTFNAVFEEEIPKFIRKKALEETKEMYSVSTSLALGLLGFVPVVGNSAHVAHVLKESSALLFNVDNMYSSYKSLNDVNTYIAVKQDTLRKKIVESEFSDKTVMLDMVDMLMSLLAEKLRI